MLGRVFRCYRLGDKKYQNAIAGLVLAKQEPWKLDIRGHDFEDFEALGRSLRTSNSLVSLNKLLVKDDQKNSKNLRILIQKRRYHFSLK